MSARAILATLVVLAAVPDADATPRYAAPTPAGTMDCSSPENACGYATAITTAGNGDEVILAPGDYGSSSSPISNTYVQSFNAIDVHGIAGQPRPRIFASGTYPLALQNAASTVRHLDMERVTTSAGAGLLLYGAGEDLVVRDDGPNAACALNYNAALKNSVCFSTGTGGSALMVHQDLGGPNAVALRNVTAISHGAGSAGMWVAGGASFASTVTAVNSIFEGLVGIHTSGAAGHEGTANTSYSQHRSDQQDANSSINSDPTDVLPYPMFVDFSGGDFHQVADSPTVDKGLDDAANGTTDYDGEPRTAGAHTDIGADEYQPPPPQGPPPGETPPQSNNPPTVTTPATPFGGLRLGATSARLHKRSIGLPATCVGAAGEHCAGTLTLTAKRRVRKKTKTVKVGSAKFLVAVGSSPKLTIKLSKSAARALRRRNLTVTAKAVARSDAGETKTSTTRIAIKRPKRRASRAQ